MKIAFIACAVFTRPLCRLVAESNQHCRIWFVEQGLHDTPSLLPKKIQEIVDEVAAYNEDSKHFEKYDAIVLAYGLCSNAICGIKAVDTPIIVPKTDDCIAIFLGSQKKYLELFHNPGGINWYNDPWFEHGEMPTVEYYAKLKEVYIEEYGEDNADFLMETLFNPLKSYRYAAYIKEGNDNLENIEKTKRMAEHFGWGYMEVDGDYSMLKRLTEGDFREEEVLIVKPGEQVEQSFDENKIKAVPVTEE